MTLDPTRFSIVRKSNRRIVAEVRVGYDIPSNLCVAFDVAVDTGTTLEIHGNQTTVVVTPTSMTFRHGPWREYLDLSTVSGDPISLVQGAFFSVLKESPATSLNYRLREERSRELLTQHLGRFGKLGIHKGKKTKAKYRELLLWLYKAELLRECAHVQLDLGDFFPAFAQIGLSPVSGDAGDLFTGWQKACRSNEWQRITEYGICAALVEAKIRGSMGYVAYTLTAAGFYPHFQSLPYGKLAWRAESGG